MKNLLFLSLAGMLCFCACTSESDPIPANDGKVKVRFQLDVRPDIVAFGTRSMPSDNTLPAEPQSANTTTPEPGEDQDLPETDPKAEQSTFSFLEYIVFNEDEEVVRQQQYENEGSGTESMEITDEFTPGIYTICFLAHSSDDVELDGTGLTFPSSVSECFYCSDNFEVVIGDDILKSFTLKRIVSRVEFVPKDTIPEEVASFKITTSGIYNTFNLISGYATEETTPFTLEKTFTETDRNAEQKIVHSFYTFVPQTDEPDGKATLESALLQALNTESEAEREKTIRDIPIYANRITRYTGNLYTNINDANFTIEIDTQWGETIEEIIED